MINSDFQKAIPDMMLGLGLGLGVLKLSKYIPILKSSKLLQQLAGRIPTACPVGLLSVWLTSEYKKRELVVVCADNRTLHDENMTFRDRINTLNEECIELRAANQSLFAETTQKVGHVQFETVSPGDVFEMPPSEDVSDQQIQLISGKEKGSTTKDLLRKVLLQPKKTKPELPKGSSSLT